MEFLEQQNSEKKFLRSQTNCLYQVKQIITK